METVIVGTVVDAEFVENENQLVKIVAESGLEKSKAQKILEKFADYFKLASDWEKKGQKSYYHGRFTKGRNEDGARRPPFLEAEKG